jgi:hypothetical protein
MATLLRSVTQQLGIVAVQIPLPEQALAFLNRALDAIQAAQTDVRPVPTPTRQVLDVAPQDLSKDDEVVWLKTLPAAPQVNAPFLLPADDDDVLCDADYDSASEDLDLGEDLERITWSRDTQDLVGNDDLARDDVVLEQPVPCTLGFNRRMRLTACTTLVRHTLEQKINRCNSNSRRPLVPFRLQKWEKKKRLSQVHTGLLFVVVRRRSGVLLVVQV